MQARREPLLPASCQCASRRETVSICLTVENNGAQGTRDPRDFDRETIVVYQAYSPKIAEAAVEAQRFVAPFSFGRMTWIKPSFLWLMQRSNWGQKTGQECVLAVRITRAGWEKALSLAVLTAFEPAVFPSAGAWAKQFREATVHVQWDPERSLRGLPALSQHSGRRQPAHHPGVRRGMDCRYRGLHATRSEDVQLLAVRTVR